MNRHVLIASALLAGCGGRDAEPSHKWVKILGTQDFYVAVDTANVQRLADSSYYLYYLNERTKPESSSNGAWNQQVMHGALRCSPLSFKTPHVALRLNNGPIVTQSGMTNTDSILARPWRVPRAGSMDSAMMDLACAVVSGRFRTSESGQQMQLNRPDSARK